VDVKTVVARRQAGKLRCDAQARLGVGQAHRPTCLPIPLASIAFMVTVRLAASTAPAPTAAITTASGAT
jgi:hypothetical protein